MGLFSSFSQVKPTIDGLEESAFNWMLNNIGYDFPCMGGTGNMANCWQAWGFH